LWATITPGALYGEGMLAVTIREPIGTSINSDNAGHTTRGITIDTDDVGMGMLRAQHIGVAFIR
jgi:hypothetical protein